MIQEFKELTNQVLKIRTVGLIKWSGVAFLLGLIAGGLMGAGYLHFGWAVGLGVIFSVVAPIFKAALDE